MNMPEQQQFQIIAIAAAAFFILLIIVKGYIKAPPDTVYIISGLRKHPRMIIGKASYYIPFIERVDKLSMRLTAIEVKTSNAVPTADYINVLVDANVNVKISSDPAKLQLAAQNFLNRNEEYIAQIAREVLEGNMREIVGQMSLKDMVGNRQKFAEYVKDNAEPDLAKMGLDIVSFNVQNFRDNNGVIDDLGIDNIVQIKKVAAIAKAEGERDIQIAQAEAAMKANDAKIISDTRIAEKNNELAITQADLKKDADLRKAAADAAYSIEEQKQRKTVEIETANAEIAKTEMEAARAERAVAVQKQVLAAQVKEQAEAERFAREQKAEAAFFENMKAAESIKFSREQEALAMKVEADAAKYAKEQEAAGVQALGLAEAEAIKAKSLAEAEGINAKAEAMKKMGEAAILEMYFKVLPDVVAAASAPLSQVDKITMYGEGNNTKLVKDIIGTTTQVTESLKHVTGIDLASVITGFIGGKESDISPSTGT